MLQGLRGFAAVMGCVPLLAAISGCGNTGEVCDQTKKAFEGLAVQMRTVPASDAAQWRQAVTTFAVRLDALARTADDQAVRKALADAAAAARAAATGLGSGDTAKLQRLVEEQPQRIGKVCS